MKIQFQNRCLAWRRSRRATHRPANRTSRCATPANPTARRDRALRSRTLRSSNWSAVSASNVTWADRKGPIWPRLSSWPRPRWRSGTRTGATRPRGSSCRCRNRIWWARTPGRWPSRSWSRTTCRFSCSRSRFIPKVGSTASRRGSSSFMISWTRRWVRSTPKRCRRAWSASVSNTRIPCSCFRILIITIRHFWGIWRRLRTILVLKAGSKIKGGNW